ncbi:MAG: SpoIID/LytB domain-containing protein [Euryarchaeota archaeon]|nr:SpoIID/LytB domain-containing protein [Euryarchaeota archaeon]
MKKGVKIWALILVLMVVGSVFSGVVSADNVSEDFTKSVADAESFDKSGFILNSNSSFAESSSSITIRVKRSTYGSGQIETLYLESEYLPVVVACENANAPYESMKAQAIAARTFAMYKKNYPQDANFDVYDDTRDQVYNPAKTVTSQHRQSVTDTNGVVLGNM